MQEESGRILRGKPGSISRRAFLGITGMSAAAVMLGGGPLQPLGARTALGQEMPSVTGYGPLVPKGDLRLPAAFDCQIISVQGEPQRDGTITPGIFDAMGAFPDVGGGVNPPGETTILIRNHENRLSRGKIAVVVPPVLRYDEDPRYNGGCTKLVVKRTRDGKSEDGQQRYEYEVVDSFNILGGTNTNCAGGEMPFKKWITCEEVVNRGATGKKHGYVFEVHAMSDVPVKAVPIPQAGRCVHEAAAWRSGILYLTEDRRVGAAGGTASTATPPTVGSASPAASPRPRARSRRWRSRASRASTRTPSPSSASRSRSSGCRSPSPITTTTRTTVGIGSPTSPRPLSGAG